MQLKKSIGNQGCTIHFFSQNYTLSKARSFIHSFNNNEVILSKFSKEKFVLIGTW